MNIVMLQHIKKFMTKSHNHSSKVVRLKLKLRRDLIILARNYVRFKRFSRLVTSTISTQTLVSTSNVSTKQDLIFHYLFNIWFQRFHLKPL